MTLRGRFTRALGGSTGTPPSAETAPPRPARKGRGTTGKMRRAKPPNVIGRGPLLSERGFGVAIVCIVKDEADYLEEWLAYHVALGIDHVFLYDNGSTDGTAELLARYQAHGLVTVVDWPLGGGQLAAYNHALRFFGATAEWLAFYDVDEFLVPLLDDDIPSFLARFGDAADVRVERKEFGFSDHRTPPAGLTIDAYTQVANVLALDPDLPPRVKSIVQPASVSAIDVHLAFPADELPADAAAATAEVEVRGVAQLNHYYTRSFEEFEAKRIRGSATGRIARPAVPFDTPTLAIDTAAQRFSARTSAMIDELRSLEPEPYTYGSALRLPFFPRPNDLGRFGEFAIANTAARIEAPSRVAASRVRNLYDGIGILGDLSAADYEPRRGDLSSSVHTATLIEHMRGRLDRSLVDAAPDDPPLTVSGTLTWPDDGAASLSTVDGAAELRFDLDAGPMRRCYALGLLGSSDAPLVIEVRLERDDVAEHAPLRLEAPASRCLAAIVEVDARPDRSQRASVRFETTAQAVGLYDLFLISYG